MDEKKKRTPQSKRQAMREERARKARRQRITVIASILGVIILVVALVLLSNQQRASTPVGAFTTITPLGYTQTDGVKIGNPEAKVVIDIYEDFKCSACQSFTQYIEPEVIKNLVDTGQAYYVFHNLPFMDDSTMIKESDLAAHAVMCAAEQNRFWDYKAMLYANLNFVAGEFNDARLKAFAESLGLNTKDFNACYEDKKYQPDIDLDVAQANSMSITGTPSVFVNGQAVAPGYVPTFEQIKEAVDKALAQVQ
ncbi:MAG: thioredoxin domain-containing protein [Chloroflexota bacterium]